MPDQTIQRPGPDHPSAANSGDTVTLEFPPGPPRKEDAMLAKAIDDAILDRAGPDWRNTLEIVWDAQHAAFPEHAGLPSFALDVLLDHLLLIGRARLLLESGRLSGRGEWLDLPEEVRRPTGA